MSKTELVMLIVAILSAACSRAEPLVEQETPEQTAQSVGRVLCAEHRGRVEAIAREFEQSMAVQRSKAKLFADPSAVEQSLQKLEKLAEFFDAHEDELGRCEVVLTDLDTVETNTKVHLSLKLEVNDWAADEKGELSLERRLLSVVLTLTRIEGSWKVTASNQDFALPGGALRSLMD